MKKVIFVASSGGHLTEILKLDKLFKDYDYLLVTEETDLTKNLVEKYNTEFLKYGPNKNIFKYIAVLFSNVIKCIKMVNKFRPQTVVSTGAQIGGIMCMIAKLRGAKIVYIESLAKVDSLSVTARNVYPFADEFFVQWENLTKKYKKAKYLGRLI